MAPKILIVEDNDSFATVLEKLLTRRGLTVERAGDGHDALCRIAASPPAVLLLDLHLPKLNGVELLKKLRQSPRSRDLPVIMMTGVYPGERYAHAAQALGVRHYLEKPFRTEALLAALRDLLPPAPGAPSGLPVARHLLQAYARRFSGCCRLRNAVGEWELLLLHGTPVALRPGFIHRDFGDYLLQQKLLTADEYAYFQQAGGRDELIVQMGCLDHPRLLQEKLAFLHQELISAFAQPPMTLEAQPLSIAPELQLMAVSLPDILCKGLRRHPDKAADRQFLAAFGDHYVGVSSGFFRQANYLHLDEEEKRLLAHLDGKQTVRACLAEDPGLLGLLRTLHLLSMLRVAEAPFPPEAADFPQRTLFNRIDEEESAPFAEEALENFTDLVDEADLNMLPEAPEARTSPAPAAHLSLEKRIRDTLAELEGKNYYEIFGLTQQKFSFDRLKERYFAMTREFGPDVLMQIGGEEATMVEKILDTVTAAYNTLSEVVKKERYDELLGSEKIGLGRQGDDIFQAQVQFQSGKVFLEMEEWDSAEKALQDACNIEPRNGVYLAHLAWSIYRNPANANSRAVLDKARQMLNRSLTMDRSAEAFAFKGQILLSGGQDGLAEIEFNKALRLNARLSLARSGLRQIQEKREQENKGLFRRIFS